MSWLITCSYRRLPMPLRLVLLRQLVPSSNVRGVPYALRRTDVWGLCACAFVFLLARDGSTNDAHGSNGRVPITSGYHLSIRTYAYLSISHRLTHSALHSHRLSVCFGRSRIAFELLGHTCFVADIA